MTKNERLERKQIRMIKLLNNRYKENYATKDNGRFKFLNEYNIVMLKIEMFEIKCMVKLP